MSTPPITVSAFVEACGSRLRADFPRVRVLGEISDFKTYASSHGYFKLKDQGAIVSCVIFKSNLALVPFRPESGMQVVVTGRTDIYAKSGSFQLVVTGMEPVGAGAQDLARQQLDAELQALGYYDAKRPVPTSCTDIAVVTSPNGAVIRDILTVIERRCGGVYVTIYPCAVQGANAPDEISAALLRADAGGHQVIIVARGGGAAEDLAAFDSLKVCVAVHDCATPTVSAVGHETDFSLCDKVADARAATPSQAAEMVSPDLQGGLARLKHVRAALTTWTRVTHEMRNRQGNVVGTLDDWSGGFEYVRQRLAVRATWFESIGPDTVLKRGYAIVRRADGKTPKAGDVIELPVQYQSPGEMITIEFENVRLRAQVTDLESKYPLVKYEGGKFA